MPDWKQDAACRDADPELFFPPSEDVRKDAVARQVGEAKAVCAACPVWSECLTWAVDTGQGFGIWGGLTSPERRRFARGSQRSDAA